MSFKVTLVCLKSQVLMFNFFFGGGGGKENFQFQVFSLALISQTHLQALVSIHILLWDHVATGL